MAKRLGVLLAILFALLITPALMADHGHGKHKGNPHFADNERHGEGWERRGDYEYRAYGRDERPPGWSRGNKTGWRDCGMPPGQAKKYGCYSYINEGRRHYYYEDGQGVIYERRPVINVHASVDVVR